MENKNNIYPPLPSAPSDEGHNYRLQKINEIHKEIENEKKKEYTSAKSIIALSESFLL